MHYIVATVGPLNVTELGRTTLNMSAVDSPRSPFTHPKHDAITVTAMEAAMAVVHKNHLPANAFVFGIASVVLKAFLVGAFPRCLAAYFLFEFPVLLALVVTAWRRERKLLYLAEFCWVVNMLGWFSVALELAHAGLTQSGLDALHPILVAPWASGWISDAHRIMFARAFFTIANGPLALTVVMNANTLVFHDAVKTSGFFIHFSPALASWALRWHDAGELFALDHAGARGGAQSYLTELYLHPLAIYFTWWVLYGIWLIAIGYRLPGTNPTTEWGRSSFNDMQRGAIHSLFPSCDGKGRLQAVAYLVLHATMVALGLALPSLVFYHR